MSKIFTTDFKSYIIDKFVSASPLFYMFLGKHLPFPDDSVPPTPVDRVSETYTGAHDTMFAAKAVRPIDVSHMIPRNEWVQGQSYIAYRDTSELIGNTFYVSVPAADGYDVFKCLSNNKTVSMYAPDLTATSPSADDAYETADGYQWKFMYTIPQDTYDKFASRDYIPVFANTEVVNSAVDGAIDYIDVVYGGSNYDSVAQGTLQTVAVSGNTQLFNIESSASSNSGFYVGSALKITQGIGAGQMRPIIGYTTSGSTRTVVVDEAFAIQPSTTSTYEITPYVVVSGGGTNFQGRALVNTAASNSIYKVEITNRGQGYNYGSAVVSGNTGGVANAAILSIVIGPKGGHGSDPIRELGGKYLCMTTTFDYANPTANTKIVPANQFRSIGIMVNPKFANVQITYTNADGLFTVGDTVTQNGTGATATIAADDGTTMTLTNVLGNISTGNTTVNYIKGTVGITPTRAAVTSVRNNGSDALTANADYINTTTRVGISAVSGTFGLDDIVTMTGNVATSNAVVYFANTSTVWLTNAKGNFGGTITSVTSGASATIDSVTPSDFIYGSGQILYLENISPINKTADQTETIKAIIEF